jgi:hypothetical protein
LFNLRNNKKEPEKRNKNVEGMKKKKSKQINADDWQRNWELKKYSAYIYVNGLHFLSERQKYV